MSKRGYVCSHMKNYAKAHGVEIPPMPRPRWWQFIQRFRAWRGSRVRKEFRNVQFPHIERDPMNTVPYTFGPMTPTPMPRPRTSILHLLSFTYPEKKTDE